MALGVTRRFPKWNLGAKRSPGLRVINWGVPVAKGDFDAYGSAGIMKKRERLLLSGS